MILFAVRSLVVGLGFFGVVYCLLSLLVVCAWQGIRFLSRDSGVRSARVLFGLRIFPLVGSAFITVAFALPAFYRLEGGMDEDMGTLMFGVGTALLLAGGLVRVLAVGVCVTALAACSSGSSTGNKNSGGLPPKAVQTEVAASVASSITSEITAMTTTSFSPFLALFNRVSPGGNVPAINLAKRITTRGTQIREGTDCPTITPAEIDVAPFSFSSS